MVKKSTKNSIVSDEEYEESDNDNNIDDNIEDLEAEEIDDNEIIDSDENNESSQEESEEDDTIIYQDEVLSSMLTKNKKKLIPKNQRISINRMTKYEFVRIIGQRVKQLTMGAKPMVKLDKKVIPEVIAEHELKLNQIPYKIVRYTPNGLELWSLDELYKDHLYCRFDDNDEV